MWPGEDCARLIQNAPVEMQPGTFWLQFEDSAGKAIDVLGPEAHGRVGA